MLASSLYAKIAGSRESVDHEDKEESEDGSGTASDAPGSGTTTPKERKARTANGQPAATSMAGGRRRKAVKRK